MEDLVTEGSGDPGARNVAMEVPALPETREQVVALAREGLKGGRPAEGFDLLARALHRTPRDATLAVLAARLVTAHDAARPVLDALAEASASEPIDLRIVEAEVLALHSAGRSREALEKSAALETVALRRLPTALLVADVAAATGDHAGALERLVRAEGLAAGAPAGAKDLERRRNDWTIRRDLAHAVADRSAESWRIVATHLAAPRTTSITWDDAVAAARTAGMLKALLPALNVALTDPTLRDRLEPVFVEASSDDPGLTADRLAEMPGDTRRALRIDDLLLAAGRPFDADRAATTRLEVAPSDNELGRRLTARLADRARFDEIEAICRRALAAVPTDGRWAMLWAGHSAAASRWQDAISVLERCREAGSEAPGLLQTQASFLVRAGEPTKALALVDAAEPAQRATAGLQEVRCAALSALGRRDELAAALARTRDLAGNGPVLDRVTTGLDWLSVPLEAGEILARIPVAQPLRGVVIVVAMRSPLIVLWSTLVAAELRRRGWETVFLDSPAATAERSSDPDLAALDGTVDPSGRRFVDSTAPLAPHPDWIRDDATRRLTRAGYDLHQAVRERIATTQRRYRVVPGLQADGILTDALVRADVAIDACERIEEISKRRGLDIRILSSMTHYSPACVYKQFCGRPRSGPSIEYVEINVGYEQYRTNDYDENAGSISLANLTRHSNLRSSIHSPAEKFEDWLRRNPSAAKAEDIATSVLHLDRAGSAGDPEAIAVATRIEEHRAAGGRVICLLGKITYDIAIEREGGPAHADMTEWLNDTIDAVRDHDDVLLLIKPHPYETLEAFARPTERFADLIDVPLPDNCIVLGHRWFNLAALLSHVDLVTIWHGTATLETLAQGVPILVCAEWGAKDHPIETTVPVDRADYHDLLLRRPLPVVTAELRSRARGLIAHLVSDEVIVPYPYGRLYGLRGGGARRWGWNHDLVERYLSEGDPWITYLADLAEQGHGVPPGDHPECDGHDQGAGT